ncbi:MAG: KH domain-containing protein [Candidatus Thorarchaeota archaeon]|jgi:predicted RNA-binding protein YlqC (UPF0109 family)
MSKYDGMEVHQLVEAIVVSLVDNTQDVVVKFNSTPKYEIIQVSVNPDDRGKVIGGHGKNITAIRTLLNAFSGRDDRMYLLEFDEG